MPEAAASEPRDPPRGIIVGQRSGRKCGEKTDCQYKKKHD